jgi:serine/threonine protein phosphatase PrpC
MSEQPASRAPQWLSAATTHAGLRRRTNEDALLSTPEAGLWVVADGMGGHDAGDFAATSITEALERVSRRADLVARVDQVEDLLCAVNACLRHHAVTHCEGRTVGSTVVAFLSEGDVGVVLWAGDSRLYRLRADEFVQITRDHNPVAELLDDGFITEQTALERETNIITRAVGGDVQLNLDVAVFDVRARDVFLLCSDGLYRELSDEEIGSLLEGECPETIAQRLVDACLDRGARDNVSVVVSQRIQ